MNNFLKITLLRLLVVLTISSFLSASLYAKVYDFTEGNKLSLIQDAREGASIKLKLIREAKHHIHIMSYYLDKSGFSSEVMKELRNAHQRGVDVRIMTTFIPSFSTDILRKAKKFLFFNKEKDNGKAVLAFLQLTPGSHETAVNNIHEKIFLVDAEKAILGGRNISDHSFNAKDLEVMLEGPIVNQVQAHFQKMFSFMTNLQIAKKCKKHKEKCSNDFNRPKFNVDDPNFFPEQPHFADGVRARILTNELLIEQHKNNYSGDAKLNIKDDIIDTVINVNFTKMRGYNYFILPTDRYKNFLEKNLALGKSIDIITNSLTTAAAISDKGYLYSLPEMKEFVEKGLSLHQWLGTKQEVGKDRLFYLHEKVMLFDDDHGFIGSHNFGVGSTAVSSEITVEFYSKEIVQILNDVFDNEINDPELTKEATLPQIEQEMHDNRKMIKFLRSPLIRNTIQEMY